MFSYKAGLQDEEKKKKTSLRSIFPVFNVCILVRGSTLQIFSTLPFPFILFSLCCECHLNN